VVTVGGICTVPQPFCGYGMRYMYCAAAILWLRYAVHVLLFSILNTFTLVLLSSASSSTSFFLFLLLLIKNVKTIIQWCIYNCPIFVMLSSHQS
jgi:hypothetical protein